MSDFLTFMAAPVAACLIFSVVLTFFGCHVLKREIIFVDIALAQLAAFGVIFAETFVHTHNEWEVWVYSLISVIAGAAFFANTRKLTYRVPQEAVIGIVYVVTASAALIVASQATHGAEHIQNILNGSILWMTWPSVLKVLGVAIIVAIPHWIYRKKFMKLSNLYRQGGNGLNNTWWDFLFYLSLGLVIVTSIKTAGMFLIFAFLIVPAVIGALFSTRFISQYIIGSVISALTSLTGLILSFNLDLPTGATLVCTFGLVFIVAIIISKTHK